MAQKQYVDHVLVHWGEEVLWEDGGPVRKNKTQAPLKVLTRLAKAAQGDDGSSGWGSGAGGGGGHDRAMKVRAHLNALVSQAPQVMVKITGGGADMKRIGSHIDYIARGGRYKKKTLEELEIETEDGLMQGKEARAMLKEWFAHGGAPIPDEVQDLNSDTTMVKRQRREALNMILSMPHGINRELVKAAARATVTELFGGKHLFAMVHHEDTAHQHTHVVVKMVGHDGKRLNPRKADLENWRLIFAKHLNERGVEAVATRRRARLKRSKGESQAVRQMKERGKKPQREQTAQTQTAAQKKAAQNQQRYAKAYQEMAKALSQSDDPADRQLAKGVQNYLQAQGVPLKLKQVGIR